MSKTKRNAISRAIEQLTMEDYEVYVRGSVATFMNGKVGVDSESRLLFCDNPRHMEFLARETPKTEIIAKVKDLLLESSAPKLPR
jgi:hypothetical protein